MTLERTSSFVELIKQHSSWYPLMGTRDVYKLLYQGTMGSEHIISTPDDFIRRLQEEFAHLLHNSSERLTEPVRPDHTLLRLNLRPYKHHHSSVDLLIAPLLDSAGIVFGGLGELHAAWMDFYQVCQRGNVSNFNLDEINKFTSWLENSHFPSVHHSEIYRREYQPAYRLISDQFLDILGLRDAY